MLTSYCKNCKQPFASRELSKPSLFIQVILFALVWWHCFIDQSLYCKECLRKRTLFYGTLSSIVLLALAVGIWGMLKSK
jgi:hypothetical protein